MGKIGEKHSHFLNLYLLRLQKSRFFFPIRQTRSAVSVFFLASLPSLPRRFYTCSRPFVGISLASLAFAKNTAVLQSNTYSFKRSIIPLCNLPQFCHRCCLVCLLSPQLQSRASQQRSRIGSNGTNSFYFQYPRQRGYKENYLLLDQWCPEWLPRLSSSHKPQGNVHVQTIHWS